MGLFCITAYCTFDCAFDCVENLACLGNLACVVALQVVSGVPMLTTFVIVIFCIYVQLHKLILMGVFQEDMLKTYKQPTLCVCVRACVRACVRVCVWL